MDRNEIIDGNRRELARLQDLLAQLTDTQLNLDLGEGWTVSVALAHLAFWDQRAIVLIDRWEREGVGQSEIDRDAVNLAILPQWLALQPRTVVELTLRTAKAVDERVAGLSAEIFEWCR